MEITIIKRHGKFALVETKGNKSETIFTDRDYKKVQEYKKMKY